jgi:hypothetical protein
MDNNLSDDAGGNPDQNIIWACLNPVITSRWSTQAMAAPIINYVLFAAIFVRKAPAFAQVMPWAGSPVVMSPVILCAAMVVMAIGLRATAAIVTMIIAVGERGAAR